VGTVYQGDAVLLASANYTVDVYQEFIEGSSSSGPHRIPGMMSASGVISGALPMGTLLKLSTGSGYSLEFFITDGNGTMRVSGPILKSDGTSLF
jgi:hypothetical protein